MTRPGQGPVVVRGGGDLATGVVWRLYRAGFDVVVTELARPLTVRRTVAVSTAVAEGVVMIEGGSASGGLTARLVEQARESTDCWERGEIPVVVSPELAPVVDSLGPEVVVDARLAKRNLDTRIDDAPLVVALGPGFRAGPGGDCHAVVETQRGSRLGRVIWQGLAAANTGVPGVVGGRGAERVLRAPFDGTVEWDCAIGDRVAADAVLGSVAGEEVTAPFDGVVRGLIATGTRIAAGSKIGDVDPRFDVEGNQVSDKALAVGGGVVEAVGGWWSGRAPVVRR